MENNRNDNQGHGRHDSQNENERNSGGNSWGSESQRMDNQNTDFGAIENDLTSESGSQNISRGNESDSLSEPDHNTSSGSAYLEEDVDKTSLDVSGNRNHDYMENNGNSTSDYNLSGLNEDPDSTSASDLGNSKNDWDGGSHSQQMNSDNDDFNSSGFEDEIENKSFADRRSSDSRTFNEDEATWNEERRISESEGENSEDSGSGKQLGNRGTSNNNWDANDQMQRGRERHGDDDEKNSLF